MALAVHTRRAREKRETEETPQLRDGMRRNRTDPKGTRRTKKKKRTPKHFKKKVGNNNTEMERDLLEPDVSSSVHSVAEKRERETVCMTEEEGTFFAVKKL